MLPLSGSSPAPVEGATQRLLLVDDDVELCHLLAEFLQREGFEVEFVHEGRRGLEVALDGRHAVIVLDVMLPGLGGFEVLKRIRERKRTPILMLTARGEHVDRIVGLELGADDYVPKPFDPRELAARIRAVLRRTEPPRVGERVAVGAIAVDPAARAAWCNGRSLDLTPVEFDLLLALVQSAGRVLSRDELSRVALGRPYLPLDRSVDTHVSNLRHKLGAGASASIRTVRSAGYLLTRADADDAGSV